MKRKKIYVFFGLVFLLIANSSLYSRFQGNMEQCAYVTPDGKCQSVQGVMVERSMKEYIVENGASFLLSYAYWLDFLTIVERSELDGVDLVLFREYLDKVIFKLEVAVAGYDSLVRIAAVTPYKRTFVRKLQRFDYQGFMQAQQLNEQIFENLQHFLAAGDVTGTFAYTHHHLRKILKRLYRARSEINQNLFPDTNNLWRTNQQFSEVNLFGQYAAEVFAEIKGNTSENCQ